MFLGFVECSSTTGCKFIQKNIFPAIVKNDKPNFPVFLAFKFADTAVLFVVKMSSCETVPKRKPYISTPFPKQRMAKDNPSYMQGANQNVRKLLCADLVNTNDCYRFHCLCPPGSKSWNLYMHINSSMHKNETRKHNNVI